MTPTRKPAPRAGSEPELVDRHLERGRAAYNDMLAAGGDVMAATLAWISTSFDADARADMLKERDERNRKIGDNNAV